MQFVIPTFGEGLVIILDALSSLAYNRKVGIRVCAMNISRVLLAQARPTMMNHSTSIYARCFDFNFNPWGHGKKFFILHLNKQG